MSCEILVEVDPDDTYVIPVLPGKDGKDGTSGDSTLQRIAEVSLSGHRVVMARPMRQVNYPDITDVDHAALLEGITLGAASSGQSVDLQFFGEMIESSWNWSLGPVYCGQYGVLTQTVPAGAWLRQIGVAVATDTIIIDFMQPIYLT